MAAPLASRIRDELHNVVVRLRRQYLIRVWQMDLGEGTLISLSAKLDKTNPRGIHIGKYTAVAFGAAILTHDAVNNRNRDVHIGDNCFIGAHSIILPRVTIGHQCIVSAPTVAVRGEPPQSRATEQPG